MAILGKEILELEGHGYCNDVGDHGGETKYGISKRSYPDLDIKNLTEEQAMEIYKRDFWDLNGLGGINSQSLANLIFYNIVNMGATRAIKRVQIGLLKYGYDLKIDGVFGSKTLQAINEASFYGLEDTIRVLQCRFYLDLVTHDKTQDKFFKGWIKRALA